MHWRSEPDLSVDQAFWKTLNLRHPRPIAPSNRPPLHFLAKIENRVLTLHVLKSKHRQFDQRLELDGNFSDRSLTHVFTFYATHLLYKRGHVDASVTLDTVGDAPLFFDYEIAFLDGWSLYALRGIHDLETLHAQFYNAIEQYVKQLGIKVLYLPVIPANRRTDFDVSFTEQESYWRFCTARGYRRASYETFGKRLNGTSADGLLVGPMSFENDWLFCEETDDAPAGERHRDEGASWPRQK